MGTVICDFIPFLRRSLGGGASRWTCLLIDAIGQGRSGMTYIQLSQFHD